MGHCGEQQRRRYRKKAYSGIHKSHRDSKSLGFLGKIGFLRGRPAIKGALRAVGGQIH
jgi:hypothetical protein